MLIYEYKLDGNKQQYAAIDETIRIVQFIRNKCIRTWMDGRKVSRNDLQCYCAVLAQAYSFAACLNSQARQASADRAWDAISRFYENCRKKKPGKKGYPRFQHDNRSVEYKRTGWRIEPDGKDITFTDGCGIGCLRLVGNKKQSENASGQPPLLVSLAGGRRASGLDEGRTLRILCGGVSAYIRKKASQETHPQAPLDLLYHFPRKGTTQQPAN